MPKKNQNKDQKPLSAINEHSVIPKKSLKRQNVMNAHNSHLVFFNPAVPTTSVWDIQNQAKQTHTQYDLNSYNRNTSLSTPNETAVLKGGQSSLSYNSTDNSTSENQQFIDNSGNSLESPPDTCCCSIM